MTKDSPRVRALLRQASKTEDVGKKQAAEQLYRQILDEAPETTAAWLGLARVINDPGAQQEAYQRVLELEPGNEAAQTALSLPEADAEPATPIAVVASTKPAENSAPAVSSVPEEWVAPVMPVHETQE